MTAAVGTTDPEKKQDIQAKLSELRRRIAELEQSKQQLEQQVTSSNTIVEAPPPVTTQEELAHTLQTLVRRVAMILQAEKCVILTYEADTNELIAQHPALKFSREEVESFRTPANEGISGEVFRTCQPIICEDCSADPRCVQENFTRFEVRDSLSVPLIVERRNENQQIVERSVIGVMHIFNKRYGLKFTDEDIRLLPALGRNAAAVISSARAFMAIASEKKQLEYTLQSMTSGLLVISRSERLQFINNAAASIFGADTDQCLGLPYREAIANEEIRDFLSTALQIDGESTNEFLVNDRFYQAQTAMVRDEKHQGVGLLCVLSDVTELRNVERMKSDFVSTVSHELRTPLTAIKGFVRTLLDDPTGEFYDQETRMEFYGIIDSECERLVRLISDLLNVSRIERNLPLQLNYDSVDIAALIESSVNFQRSYTDKHTLITDIPANLPLIVADKDKLVQVLSNLVNNAIKYSPEGGTILTGVIDEGDKLRFAIQDEGMGIPAEHIDKVFQRFHRVHSGDSQRVGGTGIGLFLVKSLVEAHGGVIWVESTLGKGSVFYFTIPKQPPVGRAVS